MRRSTGSLICLLVVLIFAGCVQDSQTKELTADDLPRDMKEKNQLIEDMKGIIVTYTGNRTSETQFIWKSDRYFMESESFTAASNGSVAWVYNKQEDEVVVREAEEPYWFMISISIIFLMNEMAG